MAIKRRLFIPPQQNQIYEQKEQTDGCLRKGPGGMGEMGEMGEGEWGLQATRRGVDKSQR